MGIIHRRRHSLREDAHRSPSCVRNSGGAPLHARPPALSPRDLSGGSGILERMFDRRLHDYFEPSNTAQSRALIDRMQASGRREAQAAADRLDAIGELFELRRVERGEQQDWAVDTWAAVGAEVAAA